MARIAGVNIPTNKRVVISLRYIYGIGPVKAQQICTTGYQAVAPTIQPAQSAQQLVDQKLRCAHYDRVNLDYVHMSWSNIF